MGWLRPAEFELRGISRFHGHYPEIKSVSQDDSGHLTSTLAKMEKDRAQADLGEAVDAEISAEKREKQKQPRKRFIGRKEAAERGEKRGDTNGTIEDSGNIQSTQRGLNVFEHNADFPQLRNQGRRPERSTKFLPRSLTIEKSMMPYLYYLRTTPLRYIKQYIVYAPLALKRSLYSSQKAYCSLLPLSPTFSQDSVLALRRSSWAM